MADAWSPSLESSSSLLWVGWHVASTLPRRIWDAYIAYLVYYQPISWVGRVASTFRVLAVLLILPVALLTLLDVTSYVIARTLGIIDDVKASTSDVVTPPVSTGDNTGIVRTSASSIGTTTASTTTTTSADGRQHVVVAARTRSLSHGLGGPGRASEGLASEDLVVSCRDEHGHDDGGHGCASEAEVGMQIQHQQLRTPNASLLHTCYFAGDEGLLAGEGVFSPAVSMPPSPVTPRMPLHTLTMESDSEGSRLGSEEGIVLRRRATQSARSRT